MDPHNETPTIVVQILSKQIHASDTVISPTTSNHVDIHSVGERSTHSGSLNDIVPCGPLVIIFN